MLVLRWCCHATGDVSLSSERKETVEELPELP
jgi:hypothetical protein